MLFQWSINGAKSMKISVRSVVLLRVPESLQYVQPLVEFWDLKLGTPASVAGTLGDQPRS